MTRCREIARLAEGYVAGALPPEEARRVAEHAARCATCAGAIDALGALPRGRERSLPPGYAATILPRVRARLAAGGAPFVPGFVLRAAAPAAAVVVGALLALQLLPSPDAVPADAGSLLQALPEADLSALADAHDSAALLTLPAGAPESATPEIEEGDLLAAIVDGESTAALAPYLDTDAELGDLGDDEQSALLAILDQR